MPEALKALWEVHAGVLPRQPDSKWTRKWYYTSSDFEEDRNASTPESTIFHTRMAEAHEYARSITHPAYVNWVQVEFFWM